MSVDIAVVVDDRQTDELVNVDALSTLLAAALHDVGVAGPAEVGLSFIDVEEMTDLNSTHMGQSGPTDVLAFPIDGDAQVPAGQPALVGDIAVCPEVAARAPQPLDDELALLVVHGALHLVGHDHAEPDEQAVMQALERKILSAHGASTGATMIPDHL